MKYPPAPLTPFLAALPQNPRHRFRPHSLAPRTAKPLSAHFPIACALFELSCRSFSSPSSLFSVACALFCKNTGVGYSFVLGGTLRHLRVLCVSSPRAARGALSLQSLDRSPVFKNLRIAPAIHRFASRAFSRTYKLLFSQLPCFQKHLRCPLLFSLTPNFLGVAQLSSLPPYFQLRPLCYREP